MNGTIFLADDSPTIQKVVELTFADTGHTVFTVSSGDELLEKLSDVNPDVVICDVIMPGTDGYSVCQTIKSGASTLHIPVVLLTGTFEPFDRDRALAAGCDEIITKPFEARNLVETVERLLGEKAGELRPAEEEAEAYAEAISPPSEAGREAFAQGGEVPAPSAEEEVLDFTTSGFAEMEAAASEPYPPAPAASDDALELDVPEEGTETPLEVPIPERTEDEESAPFSSPEATDTLAGETLTAVPVEEEAPFSEPAPVAELDANLTTPIAVGDTAAEAPAGETDLREPVVAETPEEAPAEEAGTVQPPAGEPLEQPLVEEEPELAEPATGELAPEGAPEQAAEAAAEEAVAPEDAPAPEAAALSDEDVDRIARRVVELAAERLEQIAWEVIPDMAEVVVRQRIREIEAKVAEEGEDTPH